MTVSSTPPRPERIVLIAKCPLPGKVKTRLARSLGEVGAAELQKEMISRIISEMRQVQRLRDCDVEVYFDGRDTQPLVALCGDDLPYREQPPGDLGVRLLHAFEAAAAQGVARTLVIGSDCPTIDADVITRALEALRSHDLVIGPAHDNGYCVIGMTRPIPQLFAEIPWSSDRVLPLTIARANDAGIRLAVLEPHGDVDTIEDLKRWRASQSRH